jgi:pimeloyl-ACP methyl ester carboxylesterase
MANGRVMMVNGAELWVEEAGDGRAVVLVHAGVTDSLMWDAQCAAFAERYRVVRYDLRGYGRAGVPPEPFAHHEDLLALMDVLEIDAAYLVGASMGGEVALACALEWPERVRGVVVANTRAGTREASKELRAGWKAVDEALEAGDLEGAVEIELRMWVDGPHRRPDDVDGAVRERVREMDRVLLMREAEQELADEREIEPRVVERLE